MGSSQSSLANQAEINSVVKSIEREREGGRKYTKDILGPTGSSTSVFLPEGVDDHTQSVTRIESFSVSHEEDETSSCSTASCLTDEDDEEWEERLRILEDCRKLKQVAEFFLRPEKSVESSVGVTRCFFDRESAPERVSKQEADEKAKILQDAMALKELSVDYLHPELPVEPDAYACARNYFSRPSAQSQESPEDAAHREAVLSDAKALKAATLVYLHPERPVKADGFACARSYFSRPSAPIADANSEERELILQDVRALKQLAVDYLHPEVPVETTDPYACGRNFFARPSAPETVDHWVHKQVIEDAKSFKKLAVDFLHPELPVETTDAGAFGRNFFTRFSASEYESLSEDKARSEVMEDIKVFKKLAVDFLHPELPVKSVPGGRNYFSRFSAPEEVFEANEMANIMEDLKLLKQAAVDYLHPERPVVTTDPFACGRNFFTRPSAPAFDDLDTAFERSLILADTTSLKKSAKVFLHPELPVQSDNICGRNYFSRFSAHFDEDAEERAKILEDSKALKQLATDFMHPELSVACTDPTSFGRNFFNRASAVATESAELSAERDLFSSDASTLKHTAVDFLHPELPVQSHPSTCSRNFFVRPSAHPQESEDEALERDLILRDIQALKQLASDYMHPELSVVTSDPYACGRNYFDRPSQSLHDQNIHSFPPHEDDTEHEHMDHFGMDEDFLFSEFRNEVAAPIEQNKPKLVTGSDVGSNLSRSPSSVMLFNEESYQE